MQEQEFTKGTQYGLTLSLVAETVVDLGMELREAKAALSRWKKSRGGKCAAVQFQVVSPASEHAEVQRVLDRLYRDDNDPGPFLRGLRVEVALLNDKGKRVKDFVLGDASEAVTAAPKAAGPKAASAKAKPGSAKTASTKTPAAAAPPASPAKTGDDEEEGGAYSMVDDPTIGAPVPEAPKPKAEPKAVRHQLKKRQVQFALEWQKVRQPLMLFVAGLGVEGLVWVLQLVVLIMGMFSSVSYSVAAEEVMFQSEKPPEQFEEGEYETMQRVPFAVSLVVGTNNRGFGRIIYIVVECLRLIESGLWLTAYFMLLGCPDVRGTRGQVIALICLGSVNALVTLVLKLLPLTGLITFAQLPLVVPELPLSMANIDRLLPLHAFWSWLPFFAYIFAILFTLAFQAEIILFAVYLWTVAVAVNDEVLPGKSQAMMQLGLGQCFALVTYHLMSITGTSEVLRQVLWVMYLLWRAFYLWFVIWFMALLLNARTRIENILTEKDIEAAEADEEEEEDAEADEEDDDYEDDDD